MDRPVRIREGYEQQAVIHSDLHLPGGGGDGNHRRLDGGSQRWCIGLEGRVGLKII